MVIRHLETGWISLIEICIADCQSDAVILFVQTLELIVIHMSTIFSIFITFISVSDINKSEVNHAPFEVIEYSSAILRLPK